MGDITITIAITVAQVSAQILSCDLRADSRSTASAMAPPWQAQRPPRSGVDRQQQHRRSEARTIQRLLAAFDALQHHRGCQPTAIGEALAAALRQGATRAQHAGQAQHEPNAPSVPRRIRLCKHFARGRCTHSDCGFAHGREELGAPRLQRVAIDDTQSRQSGSNVPEPSQTDMENHYATHRSVFQKLMRADAPACASDVDDFDDAHAAISQTGLQPTVPGTGACAASATYSADAKHSEPRQKQMRADAPGFVPRDALTGTATDSAGQGSPWKHAGRGRKCIPVPSHCSDSHDSDIYSDTDSQATIHAHRQQGHDMAATSNARPLDFDFDFDALERELSPQPVKLQQQAAPAVLPHTVGNNSGRQSLAQLRADASTFVPGGLPGQFVVMHSQPSAAEGLHSEGLHSQPSAAAAGRSEGLHGQPSAAAGSTTPSRSEGLRCQPSAAAGHSTASSRSEGLHGQPSTAAVSTRLSRSEGLHSQPFAAAGHSNASLRSEWLHNRPSAAASGHSTALLRSEGLQGQPSAAAGLTSSHSVGLHCQPVVAVAGHSTASLRNEGRHGLPSAAAGSTTSSRSEGLHSQPSAAVAGHSTASLRSEGLHGQPSSDAGATCSNCGVRPGLQRCGHCKAVVYCSKGCQLEAWMTGHKVVCRKELDSATARDMRAAGR